MMYLNSFKHDKTQQNYITVVPKEDRYDKNEKWLNNKCKAKLLLTSSIRSQKDISSTCPTRKDSPDPGLIEGEHVQCRLLTAPDFMQNKITFGHPESP